MQYLIEILVKLWRIINLSTYVITWHIYTTMSNAVVIKGRNTCIENLKLDKYSFYTLQSMSDSNFFIDSLLLTIYVPN